MDIGGFIVNFIVHSSICLTNGSLILNFYYDLDELEN